MGFDAENNPQQMQEQLPSAPTIPQLNPSNTGEQFFIQPPQAFAPPLYTDNHMLMEPMLSKLFEQERELISRLHFTREKTASLKASTEKLKRDALKMTRSVDVQTSPRDNPQALNEQLLEKETQINLLNQEKQSWLLEKEQLMARLKAFEEKQKSFKQLSQQFSSLLNHEEERQQDLEQDKDEQEDAAENSDHDHDHDHDNDSDSVQGSTSSITSKQSYGSGNAKKRSN